MQYSLSTGPKSTRVISLTLEESDINAAKKQELEHLQKTAHIKGFRAGHAPISKIEEEYSSAEIEARSIERALDDQFRFILEKEKINPLGQPLVDIQNPEQKIFLITIDVAPEIELPDMDTLVISSFDETIASEDIDRVITSLQNEKKIWTLIDRPAALRDKVELDFEGKLEGIPFEGGSAKHHELVLGDGQFIPGFEDALVGMKSGEVKDIALKFPEKYAEHLAGKDVVFTVKIHHIFESKIPDITESWIEEMTEGRVKSLEAFRSDIEIYLKNTKQEQNLDKEMEELETFLLSAKDVEFPQALIDEEIARVSRDFETRISQYGMKREHYLESSKQTEEDLNAQFLLQANKALKLRYVLLEYISQAKIDVEPEEIETALKNLKETPDTTAHQRRYFVMMNILFDKAYDRLLQEGKARGLAKS